MKVIFYTDIFLIFNLIMNFVVLRLLAEFKHRRVRNLRVFLAALLGAVICLVLYSLLALNIYLRYLLAMLTAVFIMLPAVFGRLSLRELLISAGQLLVISYLTAGIAGTFYIRGGGSVAAIISFFASVILLLVLSKLFARMADGRDTFYALRIFIKGRMCEKRAILDTGNRLTDPIYGYPVIVVEADESTKEWLMSFPERYQLVPCRSIGCEKKLMDGLRPDFIEIETKKGNIKKENVVLAFSDIRLSAACEYNALLTSSLLNDSLL